MALDIDPKLEQIADLLDQALQSEDKRVKDALRALLTITVLCSDDSAPKAFIGPFKTLIDDVSIVKKHVSHLEDQLQHITRSLNSGRAYYEQWGHWRDPGYGPVGPSVSFDDLNDPFKYYKTKQR